MKFIKRKISLLIAMLVLSLLFTSMGVTAVSSYTRIEAENMNGSYGIQVENCSEGGQNIGYVNSNDWIKFSGVDFGTGASQLSVRVATNTNGGTIEARLGSVTGTIIGTVSVANTGGWQNWNTVSSAVSGASGVKDLYLVFKGGSGYLFNMNWLQFTAATNNTIVYQVIQGHDGDPDPDDNGAALAGYFAIKRHMEETPNRVNFLGFVYGDTTEQRQNFMINGGGSTYHGSNGKANYQFYKQYTKPALQTVGCSVFYDTTPQQYNFNATSLSQMTTSGQFIANKILWAMNNSNATTKYRVVYSAGGGENTPAEAIKYLKNIGKTDAQIKEHFAIIQHSQWNHNYATENAAKTIVSPFFIVIANQNAYTGPNKGLPTTVSTTRTSPEFANAWRVAVGGQAPNPPISGFGSIDDISDAGSHSFASNASVLDSKWNTRNNLNSPVPYSEYKVVRVKADLCD